MKFYCQIVEGTQRQTEEVVTGLCGGLELNGEGQQSVEDICGGGQFPIWDDVIFKHILLCRNVPNDGIACFVKVNTVISNLEAYVIASLLGMVTHYPQSCAAWIATDTNIPDACDT